MKRFVWGGFFVGSALGSLVPLLWGGDMISMSSIIWNAIGGIAGIFAGFYLGKSLGV